MSGAGEALVCSGGSVLHKDAADAALVDTAAAADSAGALDGAGAETVAADEDMPDSAAAADAAAASESEGSHDNSPESAGDAGSAEGQRRTRRTLLPKVGEGAALTCCNTHEL